MNGDADGAQGIVAGPLRAGCRRVARLHFKRDEATVRSDEGPEHQPDLHGLGVSFKS